MATTDRGHPSANPVQLRCGSILVANIPDACGLVRSSGKFALRVPTSKFDQVWKSLFPSVPVPEKKDTSRLLKIESLPFGTTNTMLEAWGAHNAWVFKPLRQLGARAWLVGSGQPPPSLQMSFNGNHILVRELPPKSTPIENPIVAGPKPVNLEQGDLNTMNRLPPLRNDSWAGGAPLPQPSAPVRTVTGPTADRFAAQDAKLTALEQAVQGLQESQASQAGLMTKMQQDVQQRDASLKQHMNQTIEALGSELDSSFTSALEQQSKSFESGLDDIRQLLKASAKRSREPGANDMDAS